MPLDQLQIVNTALREIAAGVVNSLSSTEKSKEAEAVNDVWDKTLAEVLAAHTWDFAKEVKSLALVSGFAMPDDKWAYAYALPSLFVRMGRKGAMDFAFERRGPYLLTDASPCIIEYISLVTDTTKFPTHFNNALIARLKASLASPLKNSGNKGVDYLKIYEYVLGQSKGEDAQQSGLSLEDKGQQDKANDSWVGCFN